MDSKRDAAPLLPGLSRGHDSELASVANKEISAVQMTYVVPPPPAPERIPTLEEITRHFSVQWHICQAFHHIGHVLDRKPVKSNQSRRHCAPGQVGVI